MIDRLRTWATAAATAAVLATPNAAHACSVCTGGSDDESRIPFEISTAFLTVLPLAMGGGLFWLLRRRIRQIEGPARESQAVSSR